MTGFPRREDVVALRAEYPAGCRVVLDRMDDLYAPSAGAQGTVEIIDDAGTIWVSWDERCGLGVAYGVDRCHKVRTEEEAKTTVEWYGRHQPDEGMRCPRCGCPTNGPKSTHALSRWANIMVCDFCGGMEALEQAGIVPRIPLTEWICIKEPAEGKGAWEVTR